LLNLQFSLAVLLETLQAVLGGHLYHGFHSHRVATPDWLSSTPNMSQNTKWDKKLVFGSEFDVVDTELNIYARSGNEQVKQHISKKESLQSIIMVDHRPSRPKLSSDAKQISFHLCVLGV
jgi:hypothetical protein